MIYRFIKIFLLLTLLLTPLVFVIEADQPVYSANVNCLDPANKSDPACAVPRLRGVQTTIINLIYFAWVAGLPLFTFLGGLIGYQYMNSGDNSDEKAALQRRGVYWLISMIIFFASQPIAAGFMKFFLQTDDDCFDFLTTPGFTFFFSNVCNPSITPLGPGPAVTITPTP